MLLLPENLKPILADRYLHSSKTGESAKDALLHIYNPIGPQDWWISEGGPINDQGELCSVDEATDWHLFGFACIGSPQDAELGYALLSELQKVKIRIGSLGEISLEVDQVWSPTDLDKIRKMVRR